MHLHSWLSTLLALGLLALSHNQSSAQGVAVPGGVCKPVSQRTQEIGCWILADDPIGPLTKPSVFWHLDVYSTRAAAEAEKGRRGAVIESLGKVWLMTVEAEHWRPAHGTRIAEIGPLPIAAGREYSTQYMEAIFTPGMTAPAHTHSGPEAWYTLSGETCLETSDGHTQIGRAHPGQGLRGLCGYAGGAYHYAGGYVAGGDHCGSQVVSAAPSHSPPRAAKRDTIPSSARTFCLA
jgi:hypothetical protein